MFAGHGASSLERGVSAGSALREVEAAKRKVHEKLKIVKYGQELGWGGGSSLQKAPWEVVEVVFARGRVE